MSISNKYRTETMDVIVAAQAAYPDSRFLAAARARLLCECGFEEKALLACESFLVRFGADDEVLELALELRRKIGVYDQLNQAGTKSVSLCMIVKDEESCLARCLASVKPVVHELIVVDTGSSDYTVAIATAFGAKVSQFQWNGSFSDARNFGIDQAGGAWILVLDADEALSGRDYEVISSDVRGGANIAWSVTTRNYTDRHPGGWVANDGSYPEDERAQGWYPSTKVRLFPNNSMLRFNGDVHEMVEKASEAAGLQIETAAFVVHHYGELCAKPERLLDKKNAYYELGRQKLAEQPDSLPAIGELAVQAAELGHFDEVLELWDRFLSFAPQTPIALFNKGYVLMQQERFAEALEPSRQVLEQEPDHKEAAYNYGTCELYVGDPLRALEVVRPIAEKYQNYPLLQALRAALCGACGLTDQGRQLVMQLTKQGYGIAGYLQARSDALRSLGRGVAADGVAALLA